MKLKDLTIGMDVVLSDVLDAPIYRVIGLSSNQPHAAELGYTTTAGMRVNSGWHDISLMRIPTIGQHMENP